MLQVLSAWLVLGLDVAAGLVQYIYVCKNILNQADRHAWGGQVGRAWRR
jgi:hypothetical protein